jgi:hypothetical protein
MQSEVQAARTVYDYIRDGGVLAVLLFFILAGWKGIWVWGTQLARERLLLEQQRDQFLRERDEWRALAMRATATADKAVDHAAVLQKVG